jgi:hypothetical protein
VFSIRIVTYTYLSALLVQPYFLAAIKILGLNQKYFFSILANFHFRENFSMLRKYFVHTHHALKIFWDRTCCCRTDTSRCITVCCRIDTSIGSTVCCRIDTSRGSTVCCRIDTSRGSTVCCRIDTSRSSTGCL